MLHLLLSTMFLSGRQNQNVLHLIAAINPMEILFHFRQWRIVKVNTGSVGEIHGGKNPTFFLIAKITPLDNSFSKIVLENANI